jgi:biotin carboxylase
VLHGMKILIVGGGEWQVPLVRKAREMGFYIINTNLYPESPSFAYADEFYVVDVLDKEKNLEIARRCAIDGVVTDQSDIAVPTVAYVAEVLGLPGIGIDKADLFTNKFLMREHCRQFGFPTPEYSLCKSPEEVNQFAAKTGFPFVIKPQSNQSSRGVYKVSNPSELATRLPQTRKFSRNGTILVEEYVQGVEFTVEGVMVDGAHHSLAISYKEYFTENEFVASRLWYVPGHEECRYAELMSAHDRMIETMGLSFGVTHAEYKCKGGKEMLIEVAARGGGTRISSHIVPAVSGVDVYDILLRSAVGLPLMTAMATTARLERNKAAVLSFFRLSPGTVAKVRNADVVRTWQQVVELYLPIENGGVVESLSDDRSRPGHVIIVGKDETEVRAMLNNVERTLVFEYE